MLMQLRFSSKAAMQLAFRLHGGGVVVCPGGPGGGVGPGAGGDGVVGAGGEGVGTGPGACLRRRPSAPTSTLSSTSAKQEASQTAKMQYTVFTISTCLNRQ